MLKLSLLLTVLTALAFPAFADETKAKAAKPYDEPQAKEAEEKPSRKPVLNETGEEVEVHPKHTNFRIAPIGLVVGYINFEADFATGNKWTLGPALTYWNTTIGNSAVKATAVGVRANYYINKNVLEGGWIVSPILEYVTATASINDSYYGNVTATASGIVGGAYVDYQWMWSSFNMQLGAGLLAATYPSKIKVTAGTPGSGNYSESETSMPNKGGLGLDFMIGFAF